MINEKMHKLLKSFNKEANTFLIKPVYSNIFIYTDAYFDYETKFLSIEKDKFKKLYKVHKKSIVVDNEFLLKVYDYGRKEELIKMKYENDVLDFFSEEDKERFINAARNLVDFRVSYRTYYRFRDRVLYKSMYDYEGKKINIYLKYATYSVDSRYKISELFWREVKSDDCKKFKEWTW